MKGIDEKFIMAFLISKSKEQRLKEQGHTVPNDFALKHTMYFQYAEEPLIPFMLLNKDAQRIQHAADDDEAFSDLDQLLAAKEDEIKNLQDIIRTKESEIQEHLCAIESLKCEILNLESTLTKERNCDKPKEKRKEGFIFVNKAYRFFKGEIK